MDETLKNLLAPRVIRHCEDLLADGYFKESAREAMVQVEKALKEKGKIRNLYGVRLIKDLFNGKGDVVLRVPLGGALQEKAGQYFEGVFTYYRNYVAHDGALVDERMAKRILVLASELLELIDSSELSLSDQGGVEGLVRIGGFKNKERLKELLGLLHDYGMPEGAYDGLFERLALHGFGDEALEQVMSLGLITFRSGTTEVSYGGQIPECEEYEWFELTEMGNEVMENK